jgi:hypothetical protein
MNQAKRELTTAAADRWTRTIIDLCSDPAEFFESIAWRKDVRYFTWNDLARQIWHNEGFVDATRLQSDVTRLALAFKAQASHYGLDPNKCIRAKARWRDKSTHYIDLTPNEPDNVEQRKRDAENPRGEKIGGR